MVGGGSGLLDRSGRDLDRESAGELNPDGLARAVRDRAGQCGGARPAEGLLQVPQVTPPAPVVVVDESARVSQQRLGPGQRHAHADLESMVLDKDKALRAAVVQKGMTAPPSNTIAQPQFDTWLKDKNTQLDIETAIRLAAALTVGSERFMVPRVRPPFGSVGVVTPWSWRQLW